MTSDISGARCLVLGAGGFIGTNLAARLAAAGADVVGFGHRSPFASPSAPVQWIDGDFADAEAVRRGVDGADFVFHLLGGGLPESSNRDPAAPIADCVLPSIALLDSCREAGVTKLVFVSSGGTVYGPVEHLPIPETAATNPCSAYGISKLVIEKYVQLYHRLHGLNHAVLRVANPYGPYQNPLRGQGLVASLLHRMLARQPIEIWGDGSVVRDYLFVDDLSEALILAAATTTSDRVINIGSGVGRSVREVVDSIVALTGSEPSDVRYRPARAADVPANILDITLAERALGWRPKTDWEAGLRITRDWIESAAIPLAGKA